MPQKFTPRPLTPAPFTYDVAVRYLEVDQQGVVFNMWYLAYFDEAMTAFLDAIGFSYDTMTAAGLDVQLVHTEIDWRDGLRWGDAATVGVSCSRLGRTSFTLDFDVRRGDETVAQGSTVYVLVGEGGKTPLPPALRDALAAHA